MDYVFVFTIDRPDFFGVLVEVNRDFVVVEKPMIVEYTQNLSVVFNSDFMPIGFPPRYDKAFRVTVPIGRVNYIVHLDEEDSMTKEYLSQIDIRDNPDYVAAG